MEAGAGASGDWVCLTRCTGSGPQGIRQPPPGWRVDDEQSRPRAALARHGPAQGGTGDLEQSHTRRIGGARPCRLTYRNPAANGRASTSRWK